MQARVPENSSKHVETKKKEKKKKKKKKKKKGERRKGGRVEKGSTKLSITEDTRHKLKGDRFKAVTNIVIASLAPIYHRFQ